MRYAGAAALSLLIAGTSAFPQPKVPVRARDDDMCGLTADGADDSKKTWDKTGGPFLDTYFDNNDIGDWSNNFFKQNLKQGISSNNCQSIHSTTCGPAKCDDYEKKDATEAFFVHQSMTTLHDYFKYMSDNMAGEGLKGIGEKADTLSDLFGPPDPESTSFISYTIGASITGAALSGPFWQVGAPLVGIAGVMNIVNGALQDDDSLTPEQLSGDIAKRATAVYDKWNSTMGDACNSIFGGDVTLLSDSVDDPEDWIKTDLFGDGKFLNGKDVDTETKKVWASIQDQFVQGLAVMALKGGEYYVSRENDVKEDECKKLKDKNYVWVKDRCTRIIKDSMTATSCAGTATGCKEWLPVPLDKDQFEKFTGEYGFDLEEALLNAVECDATGGGEAEMPHGLPSFDEKPPMPRCFFNLKVKNQSKSGTADQKPDPGVIGPDGYTPGACGIHFEKKKPANGDMFTQISATLKGGQGEEIASLKTSKADPTVVIEGKESDDGAKLPYDFHIAIDNKDGDEVKFWYSDQYWTTTEDKNSDGKFPGCAYEGDSKSIGNCGFSCKAPSDNPPASATEAHPLPTAIPYAKGWCTFHVKQTKKGGESYNIDATIMDDAGDEVGKLKGGNVKYGDTISVKGPLPQLLAISPKKDTVEFSYDGKDWDARSDTGKGNRDKDGHECGWGGWDTPIASSDNVQMDCGFKC